MNEKQIMEAIIYSAKHTGFWDDAMTDQVYKGAVTKLYLDLPSLKQAIIDGGHRVINDGLQYLDERCPRCNGKGEYPSDYGSGATAECYYCDGTGRRPVINAQLSAEPRGRIDELNHLGFDKRLDNPILRCTADEIIELAKRIKQLTHQEGKK